MVTAATKLRRTRHGQQANVYRNLRAENRKACQAMAYARMDASEQGHGTEQCGSTNILRHWHLRSYLWCLEPYRKGSGGGDGNGGKGKKGSNNGGVGNG